MTAKQSTSRLTLYCIIAFLTPVAGNWQAMETASLFQWIGLVLQALAAAFIAARAYIDTTPSQVENAASPDVSDQPPKAIPVPEP